MRPTLCVRCNSVRCSCPWTSSRVRSLLQEQFSWDATVEAVIVSEVRHRVTIRTIDADGHSRNHHFPLDWRPNG